jgi:hypothetical protein
VTTVSDIPLFENQYADIAKSYFEMLPSTKRRHYSIDFVAKETGRPLDEVRDVIVESDIPNFFEYRSCASLTIEQKVAAINWLTTSLTANEGQFFSDVDKKTLRSMRTFLNLPHRKRDFSLVHAYKVYSSGSNPSIETAAQSFSVKDITTMHKETWRGKLRTASILLDRRATIEPMLLENLRQLYGVSDEQMETPYRIQLPRVA